MDHDLKTPSPWVVRWASLVPPGDVLDLACGNGRHARYFSAMGHAVIAVDRDAKALEALRDVPRVEPLAADLEGDAPWPLAGRRFAGIVVTNYLHRPLFARILESLAPGGALIYETFARGNERFGRPSNPAFLLNPDELLEAFGDALSVVAFEQGIVTQPKPAAIQRLCALRAPSVEAALEP